MGMAGKHHKPVRGATDEWYTPPEVIEALGRFGLDPCSPKVRLFETADRYYTIEDDGLVQAWSGRVWLNPPYGPETKHWLKKLAAHGNGIALIFARTETEAFHDYVWDAADGILFLRGRLRFYTPAGIQPAGKNSGAPSCLVAYGRRNARCLAACSLPGKFVRLRD